MDEEVVQPGRGRILASAVLTLTLSILGSSLLPLPYAFAKGLLSMALSAGSNAVTSRLVLKAAHKTGRKSYEGIAEAIGGMRWKVVTQVSLILLLFGTVVGDFALISDVATRAVDRLYVNSEPPGFLLNRLGAMWCVAGVIVLPLCFLPNMRQLETVATAGVGVIVAILIIIAHATIKAGFPAIRNGELAVWGVHDLKRLPESFAIMGFAFYLHPMLMPLLHEMPRGRQGVQLTSVAVNIVVLGIAQVVYAAMGILAASRYGQSTEGDCLLNTWLGGTAEGWLDAAMAAYLAISIPPMQHSLRFTVDCLIAGEHAVWSPARHCLETICIVGTTLAVASFTPSAEKVFATTGASAVCIVCYILPVMLHLRLRWDGMVEHHTPLLPAHGSPVQGEQDSSAADSALLPSQHSLNWYPAWQTCRDVALPIAIACIGLAMSAAALWLAIADLIHPSTH